MKKISKAACHDADAIDALIRMREDAAAKLPPGEPKQSILTLLGQLRVCANTGRLFVSPHAQGGA